MNIENVKHSHELFHRKIKLEEEFKILARDITDFQKNCHHIRISFGLESPSSEEPIERCLFCGKEDVDDSYPLIDASTYQRRLHSTYGFPKIVENGFLKFQRLCIESLEENPFLKEEDLIERIELELRRDEEINQVDDQISAQIHHL